MGIVRRGKLIRGALVLGATGSLEGSTAKHVRRLDKALLFLLQRLSHCVDVFVKVV